MPVEAATPSTPCAMPWSRKAWTARASSGRSSGRGARRRSMADLNGGHLVARTLKQAGVGHIFTLCGGHILPIYDGCVTEGVKRSEAHTSELQSPVQIVCRMLLDKTNSGRR